MISVTTTIITRKTNAIFHNTNIHDFYYTNRTN